MKQITAIVNSEDAAQVESALISAGFFLTRMATTGGFLKTGNTTFVCVADDDKVDDVIAVISEHSRRRSRFVAAVGNFEGGVPLNQSLPVEVTVGGATIIVTDVERFVKI